MRRAEYTRAARNEPSSVVPLFCCYSSGHRARIIGNSTVKGAAGARQGKGQAPLLELTAVRKFNLSLAPLSVNNTQRRSQFFPLEIRSSDGGVKILDEYVGACGRCH